MRRHHRASSFGISVRLLRCFLPAGAKRRQGYSPARVLRPNHHVEAKQMRMLLLAMTGFLCANAWSQEFAFPNGFKTRPIAANGTTINVRVGGQGPAVVLIHGYGDTGDMW